MEVVTYRASLTMGPPRVELLTHVWPYGATNGWLLVSNRMIVMMSGCSKHVQDAASLIAHPTFLINALDLNPKPWCDQQRIHTMGIHL